MTTSSFHYPYYPIKGYNVLNKFGVVGKVICYLLVLNLIITNTNQNPVTNRNYTQVQDTFIWDSFDKTLWSSSLSTGSLIGGDRLLVNLSGVW